MMRSCFKLPRYFFRYFLPSLTAATGLLLTGCQAVHPVQRQKQPIAATRLVIHGGSPLSGPAAFVPGRSQTGGSGLALVARVNFFILPRMPDRLLAPLSSRASLVLTRRGRRATLAFGRLTRGARFARVSGTASFARQLTDTCGPVQGFTPLRAAVFPGGWVSFQLRDGYRFAARAGGKKHRPSVRIEAWLPRKGGLKSLQLALGAARYSTGPSGRTLTFNRETQIISATDRPHGNVAFLIPFRFVSGNGQAVAAVLHIRPAGLKDKPLVKAAMAAAAAPLPALTNPLNHLNRPDLIEALSRVRQPDVRRAALIYMAGQTGAGLCDDSALTLKRPALKNLADRVFDSLHKKATGLTVARFGWWMDRTAYQLLYAMQKKAPLPSALQTVLALHIGEAAYHPSSLDQIAGALASRKVFMRQVIAENYIYLQDTSPAARIGAFDWLKRHGFAPPGYHPLDSVEARNTALDNAATDAAFLKRIQP